MTERDHTVGGDRPTRPATGPRVRRPLDAAWLLAALAATVLVVALSGVTSQTLIGVAEDLSSLGRAIPGLLTGTLTLAVSIVALLAAPGVFTVLLVRGRGRTAALAGTAGLVAAGLAILSGWVIRAIDDRQLGLAFTPSEGGLPDTWPFLAFLVAVLAVPRFSERSRAMRLVRWSVAAVVLLTLLDGRTTVSAVAVSLLVAGGAVNGTLFVAGVPGVRVDADAVRETLTTGGFPAHDVHGDDTAGERLSVSDAFDGFSVDDRYDVVVLTRDRIGAGLLYRLWRRLRLRGEVQPPLRFSLRRTVERELLLANATVAAGVRSPRMLAALPVRSVHTVDELHAVDGPDAVALVQARVMTRPLTTYDGEVPDGVLKDVWAQLSGLRRAGIAHRHLNARTLRVDDEGRVWVVGAGAGEVAADLVALNLDITQTLVEMAMLAGVERAVSSALESLGPEVVADAAVLLQPVLLNRETRAALREHRGLLSELRARIGATVEVPLASPRVEKFRPRTVITGIAVVFALYLVVSQLAGVDVAGVIRRADVGWMLAGIGAIAVTFVGAGYAVAGFVPERLPVLRTIAVQLGLGFIRLVAPPAVGAVAVNVRYLVRSGVSAAGAAASMAASQLVALAVGLLLLPVLGTLTGRTVARSAPGATVTVTVLGVLAIGIAVVAVWPSLRNRAMAAVRHFSSVALPRLAEVAQQPWKLVQGLGGTLLITAGYVACLDFSARAFGVEIPITLVAVVFLTGNTVGSALPTPGGLGAVEAVLTAGLTAVGVPAASAVPTVLLFRLISFWLPILPGWLTWTLLQKRNIV